MAGRRATSSRSQAQVRVGHPRLDRGGRRPAVEGRVVGYTQRVPVHSDSHRLRLRERGIPRVGVIVRVLRPRFYAVYAISSLDTGSSLRRDTQTAWGAVGTHQGVAGLAPRPFSSEEETGSHPGRGHVHRTRMLICMHNWGSSLHLPFMQFMQYARSMGPLTRGGGSISA